MMTTTRRPFRFGLEIRTLPASGAAWIATVRRAEELGYATVLLEDHLPTAGFQALGGPFAALGMAAAVTQTLRLGSLVCGNDFRHPVVLAHEAATLDLLSGGRVELGIGTGWQRSDYTQLGLPLEAPGVRIGRLAEAVRIIKSYLAGEPFSVTGTYYSGHEITPGPLPVQRPRPPLLIGGGARRTLSLAAREADIVSVNIRTTPQGDFDFASLTAEATMQKVAWMRAAAGERLAAVEVSSTIPVVAVAEDRRAVAAVILQQLQAMYGPAFGLTVDQLLASPFALIGTVAEMIEELEARREHYGFSYIVVWEPAMEHFAPVVARLAGR
jgi:probable F420-dependent oxidoreductase